MVVGARTIPRGGGVEIVGNGAERAIRPVTLGRKIRFFAGSDMAGERGAGTLSLDGTAKRNGLAA
ncbi:hypothetical protein LNKW23_29320 [Paralimibaculum aggregatum]|uniref:Transposase IS66 central domain-containing protein n=1 Tax=Paralimibaculum aggregatum TaxID=3036245 RepID=A0ABQ6LKE6_9RHOB|nr:hypothetical protein LNKW23_29320 [Limibaculum sp. NKW23]